MRRPRALVGPARALVVACAATLALGAGAFVLQAAALGRPSAHSVLAARAVRALLGYRTMWSVERLGSRAAVQVVCRQVLAPALSRGGEQHRVVVTRGDGVRLSEQRGLVWSSLRILEPSALQSAQFALAGCPGLLGAKLATRLTARRGLRAFEVRTDGVPAYDLRFRVHGTQFDYFASRSGLTPLAVRVHGDGLRAYSDLGERTDTGA